MRRTFAVYSVFLSLLQLLMSCGVNFEFVPDQIPNGELETATVTATLSATNGTAISADRSTFELVFSEKVTEIMRSHFTVSGGEIIALSSDDGITYEVGFLFRANPFRVSIKERALSSEQGNDVKESNELEFLRDTVAPTVNLSSTAPSATNLSSIPIAISFSEDVEGLELADFTLLGATVSSLVQTSASEYTLNLIPSADGSISIELDAGRAQDLAGNSNEASSTLAFSVDRAAPTVTLSTSESSPSYAASFSATATFSEQVTGFEVGGLSATNATLSSLATSDNTTFTFDVTPGSAGTVSIDITAAVATDAVGNSNTAATTLSLTHAVCPSGYIQVPGNAAVGAPNDFCVMQYEAKAWNDVNTNGIVDAGEVDADGCTPGCSTADANWGLSVHQPISQADAQPWRQISLPNAFAECRSLNSESTTGDISSDANSDGTYALISNPEWMTIARNAELVAVNWTGGSIGAGCLKQGNVGGAGSCTSPDSGYNSAADPDSGSSRSDNGTAQLELNNGSVIWDFSGNLWEWVDWDMSSALATITPSQKAYVSADGSPQFAYREFRDLDTNIGGANEMPPESWQANDTSLTSADGIGRYRAGSNSGGGAAHRGGGWNFGSDSGAFYLDLNSDPSLVRASLGFRCVFRAP